MTFNEENQNKINYAEGIKTVRLFNDRIAEIEEINEEEIE
jgi:hypothetical protein